MYSLYEPNPLYSVYFINAMTGWAGGNSYLIRTTNGGANWLVSYYSYSYNSLMFSDAMTGWAAGSSGVLKTTNGGINWKSEGVYTSGGFKAVFFVNSVTGYTGGYNGALLKTTNGGSVFIRSIGAELPQKYFLNQNYPNPFNPVTKIKFSIPSWEGWQPQADGVGLVTLKVYDITGREVQTLVNESLQHGTYEVSFDGSDHNSGVYFYKLTAEKFSETRKMILIK